MFFLPFSSFRFRGGGGGGYNLFLGVVTQFQRKDHKAKTIDHTAVKLYFLKSSDHNLSRNIKIILIDNESKVMASLI